MSGTVDLNFIAAQIRQLIADGAAMRDQMIVLTSIAIRVDNTLQSLVGQLNAMQVQANRTTERVRQLEEQNLPK
jgi:hypothetical protein